MSDVITKLQDLRYLDWSERANTSGTAGSFLKSKEQTGAGIWYYKLSCYDSYRGIYGHECANEIVASRLMSILGVAHVEYRLVHALICVNGGEHETWLNRSRSFRKKGERKQALDTFYDLNKKSGETPLELCARFGWEDEIKKIMLVDFLIANRDRHGANIEVLQSSNGDLCLAPVFDSGLSFVFSCYDDEERVRDFDPLADVNANNFLGTRSLEENLRRFVGGDVGVAPLKATDRKALFSGLEGVLSNCHIEKMWEILQQRWEVYEAL